MWKVTEYCTWIAKRRVYQATLRSIHSWLAFGSGLCQFGSRSLPAEINFRLQYLRIFSIIYVFVAKYVLLLSGGYFFGLSCLLSLG
jgi:hypothetical protein